MGKKKLKMDKKNEIIELMNRMGENISTTSVWGKVITETPIIINEGLITSYDSQMVLNAICESFHLSKNGNRVESLSSLIKNKKYVYIGDAYLTNENDEDVIKICLDTNISFIETISKRMEKYGWSLFRQDDTLDNKIIFSFEKRYPTTGTVGKLLRFTKTLYHIAPQNVINKIMKQGLIPKPSKTPGFTNEPRVYLWVNKPQDMQWGDIFKTRSNTNTNAVLLSIDLTQMDENHKIYFDNRMEGTLFSLEPIPPHVITIV